MEIAKVKREYQENKLVKDVAKVEETKNIKEKSETFKAYKEEYDKYKDKKEALPKKGKTREDFTLTMLAKFKKKLESVKEKVDESGETETKEDSDPEDSTW